MDPAQVAKKANISEGRLQSWESGDRRPTITQLRTLARVYRRPIAVFYLPTPPADIRLPTDYRRLPGAVEGVETPELRYEIRRAVDRRQIALNLLTEAAEEPVDFPITGQLTERPDNLGARIRDALAVDLDTQQSWRGQYESFNGWRRAIEAKGALVQQMTDVELQEARAFCVAEFPVPIIVLNIKDTPRGRVFSLMHEVVHVALHQDGLCDLDDVTTRSPENLRIERFCNAVAGAALVPGDSLLTDDVVLRHGVDPVWSDDELARLAQQFGISREVVLRRLLDLHRTNADFYRGKRDQFLQENEEARQRRQGGFAPPHQVAWASAGPTFIGLVLNGYANGSITGSDVSDYLGIRLKHLPRVEQQLTSAERST
jgi:Zn-dependent peptidase ImmA (M78 family)